MGRLGSRYSFDKDRVIFDGDGADCIAIDLVNGAYFTFTPQAAAAWEFIRGGGDLKLLAEKGEQATALEQFVEALLADGLLTEAAESTETQAANADGIGDLREAVNGELTFDRHTDMQDLFTIDPVHDVDTALGWPQLTDAPGRD